MTILIHDISLHKVIKTIGEQLGSDSPTFICDETTINIPEKWGQGYIKGINFKGGMGLLQLNMHLSHPITFHYQLERSHPLRLIFCQKGYFSYAFEPENKHFTIEPLFASFSTSTGEYDQKFTFPAHAPIKITILEIDRMAFLSKIECDLYTIPQGLANVFRDVNAADPFEYHTPYSLLLANCVYQIHGNTLSGLSRKTYLEAKALEMFGLIIDLYVDDHLPDKKSILLRKTDVRLIQEAEKILSANLDKTITIPVLAKKIGINTTKLKQGFKSVFGMTINKFLREKRLTQAAALLMNDSLSIRQISSMVGYANPAHFSQLFKERFGALPSEYTKNIKQSIIVTSRED